MSRKRRNKNKKNSTSANTAAAVANYVENNCGETFKAPCAGGTMNHIGTLESNCECSPEELAHTNLYDCIVNLSRTEMSEDITLDNLAYFLKDEILKTTKRYLPFDFDKDCTVFVAEDGSTYEWRVTLSLENKTLISFGNCSKRGLVLYSSKGEGRFSELLEEADKIVSAWFNEKYNIGKQLPQDHPRSIILGKTAKRYIKKSAGKIFLTTNEKSTSNPLNMSDSQVVDAIVDTIKSLEYRQLIDFDKEGAKEYVKTLIDQM